MRRLAILVVLIGIIATTPAAADTTGWPVTGGIQSGFTPPAHQWLPGHRGVDLRGTVDGPVRAPATGKVIFNGYVAGKPVVVISHGERRSTFEPVIGNLPVGTDVAKGDIIGRLQSGHEHCPDCLHWGLKIGDDYLDPLSLIDSARVQLLPGNATDKADSRATHRWPTIGNSAWIFSVTPGRIASPFGWRDDPFTGERQWHSGIDIAADCSAPIKAPLPGRVVHAGPTGGYGNRIVIDHGTVGDRRFRTTYNHLETILAPADARVSQGQVIGTVGNTGRSTGCHLHFEHEINGHLTNPTS